MKRLISYLAFIFFALFVSNLAGSYSSPSLIFLRVVLVVAATLCMLFGTFGVYEAGHERGVGNPARDKGENAFKINEIYETLSVTPLEGQFLALVRDREGAVKSYSLSEPPPKVFKVVLEDGIRIVRSYPQLSLIK